MATQAIVRQINEIKTLRALFEHGPLTRADIARRLGITKKTASNVVTGLIETGVLRDFEGRSQEARGRPGTKIGLNPRGGYFVGAEIGVDRINVVLLDLAAEVVGRELIEIPCSALGVDDVLKCLQSSVKLLLARSSVSIRDVDGLCVSLPGFMTREGVVLATPRLGWHGFSVTAKLEQLFRCPVAVENDANAFAFAEWYLTPALRDRDLLLVLLESGVGGGHISGGHLVRGAHGVAGEIGHLPISGDIDRVDQEASRTWESIIGKASLLSAAKKRTNSKSLASLRASALQNDSAAIDLVQTWARWLARGLTALAHVFDPEDIIIGGELSIFFELTQKIVEDELRKGLLANFPVPRLSASRFQSDGCAIGAAAIMHAGLFSAVSTEPVKL